MSPTSIEIPAALEGERVDRALALVTGRSRREVSELIDAGQVRLSGKPVPSRHERVRAGDRLEFELVDADDKDGAVVAEQVAFVVVFEDPELIVVDKPAGLVVHPGSGRRSGTLAAGLVERYPDLVAAGAAGAADPSRPGIVHRLDKDTSGLLAVARTEPAWQALSAQLARREMGREYVALALGALDDEEATIDAPIGRSSRDRTKMAVAVGGRPARTRYRITARYRAPFEACLLGVSLETGRTHQIRVHLAAVGHPVAGDRRYGGGLGASVAREVGLRRQFLHAARLRLVHPSSGDEMVFESPLPADLEAVLARLS